MVRAYVLIQAKVGLAGEVVKKARELSEVREAAALAGPYDAILTMEAANIDLLGSLVVSDIQQLPGVSRTITCPVIHL